MHVFPNETLGDVLDTIQLAEKLNFNWYNISLLQPWKGTPIYEEMSSDGLTGMQEGTIKDGKKVEIIKVDAGTAATDEVNTDLATYQLGTYSRQRSLEQGKIREKKRNDLSEGFLARVNAKDLNVLPTAQDLDNLWFYTNMRINFSRLLRENRSEKINQQYNFLNYLHYKTAPDNALILYFLGFMQKKKLGFVNARLGRRSQSFQLASKKS